MTRRPLSRHFRSLGGTPPSESPGSSVATAMDSLEAELMRRRAWVLELLDLSRVQLQLIETDDFDGLLRVQHQKERLAANLAAQSSGPPPLLERWLAERDGLTVDARRLCEVSIRQTEEGLRQLTEEEAMTMESLEKRMSATRSELLLIAEGQKSQRRHQATATEKRFVDFEA